MNLRGFMVIFMFRFEQIYKDKKKIQCHLEAPLLKERLQYLEWWAVNGAAKQTLQHKATNLLRATFYINFKKKEVTLKEIVEAEQRWAYRRKGKLEYKKKSRRRAGFKKDATRWLKMLGRLTPPPRYDTPFSKKIIQFIAYMRHEQGLSEGTIELRLKHLKDFFNCVLGLKITSLRNLDIPIIDMILIKKHSISNYTRDTIRSYSSTIRVFMRYAAAKKWCQKSLTESIRTPRTYKLESLPSSPTWADVGRLIAGTKGNDSIQIRDRAILMLLAIYGLRSSELGNLCLKDFDWKHNTLYIWRAKGERAQRFPLSKTVGKAVSRYIKKVRPNCSFQNVFITAIAPYHPLSKGVIYQIVYHRLKALNIELEHYGPHSLRHACASHLINAGIPLKVISNQLGHQNIESTMIYTKVDLVGLRKVAEFNIEAIL